MTKEEFASKMQDIVSKCNGDIEVQHALADDLLCEALSYLGYQDGINIFDDM